MKVNLDNEPEIKVKTTFFSMHHGILHLRFKLCGSFKLDDISLKQRDVETPIRIAFQIKKTVKKNGTIYDCTLNTKQLYIPNAFWDISATIDGKDYLIGGQSSFLKLKLILFPIWTKINKEQILYPFVNGRRQFSIQCRNYQSKYDNYFFILKEYMALLCYFLLKPYWNRKNIWLICEKLCGMAQDNGYYFFKYCMENLSDEKRKNIYYIIDKKVPDYQAVKPYANNVLSFMSFKHLLYLNASRLLISSETIRHFYIWDSPNTINKGYYQFSKNLIFLQHGVMGFKQCHEHMNKTKGRSPITRFVVSSPFEHKIITDYFDYEADEVIITGLARWDALEDRSSLQQKEILLMPTWRDWLEYSDHNEFVKSDYYKNYESLLKNPEFLHLLETHNITLNFYIHPKFREHIHDFKITHSHIRLIPFGSEPLNNLIMKCNLLITDYSSVAWDVYFQDKPIIFYAFDFPLYNQFRGSYIDLEKDAFGDMVHNETELITALKQYIENNFQESEVAREKKIYYLPTRDHMNCSRIYQHITTTSFPSKFINRLKKIF